MDAVKEFGIRIKDGSDSTNDAMVQLFAPDHLDKFAKSLAKGATKSAEYMELLKHTTKSTAAGIIAGLRKGGGDATKALGSLQLVMSDGPELLDKLSSGAIQGKDAMQMIIDKLAQIKDPIQQSTLGVALFGTQFEDMESDAIIALGSARKQFDMTKNTMEEVAAVKYGTLSQQFATIGRELMSDLVIPMGEDLMPLLKGLASWMGDNEKLLMVLALGAPAAALTKNTVSIVKRLMSIGSAASGAGGAAGGFAKAIGLLTSPVGIAVAGVGLLTAGVIAYKNHQEKARQELVHMGERLDEVGGKYQEAKEKAKLTNELIWQYDDLSQKIAAASTNSGKMATNSEQLAGQQERLRDVTQKLQDMYPDVITSHDIENGKLREKAGLSKEIADADERSYRLQQEQVIAEGNRDLPDTLKLMESYRAQAAALTEQKDAVDATVPRMIELQTQLNSILQQPSSTDRNTQLEFLLQKVNDIGTAVGLSTSSMNELMNGGIEDKISELRDKQVDLLKSYVTTDENLKKTTTSYETLYNAKKNILDMNLGGELEDMAKKFSSLSDTQKNKTLETIAAVQELNKQFNLMPASKQVNVQLLYSQTGKYMPQVPKSVSEITDSLLPKQFQMKQYADGGIATRPSVFGEAGPEIAIPLNDKPRSRSLLDMANDLMGNTGNTGETVIHVNNAPVITLPGADPSIMEMVNDAIKQANDGLERRLKAVVQQQRRVSLQ
ncbi:hypothetical protein [Paenibacillus graminis]|uniref:hypothetical protein n=1 Tax=Paenibacillus graminis TaxID=189425 RepID=UPI002DBB1AAC|nr:hypothetical protein [Paenibacillus graminis]MEC0171170.1 hypothetical protein [Paenibacillus graminis]